MKKENWVWMPHPGHFCGARDCKFHLNTYVGGYIVSTVGEYWPSRETRAITAKCKGVEIKGIGDEWDAHYFKKFGWLEIGMDRTYETMVFKARRGTNKCCPWTIADGSEFQCEGYNNAEDAMAGHLALCKQWAGRK